MNTEGTGRSENIGPLSYDEEGADPGCLGIRAELLKMPRLNCPVGFEFRLHNRIRSRSGSRNWQVMTLGWTGAGMGMAVATVIAVFVFDFHFSGSPLNPVLTNSQTAVTSVPTTDRDTRNVTPFESPAEKQMVSQVTSEEKSPLQSEKDSTIKRGTLPEGQYHTVGSSGR